jgi:hypothetical protein
MDNNQNQQPNGYGAPQPNMQAGMPGQTPQPGYGTPGQTPQPGYGMPGQGVQPGMQAGMPGQTPQPGYGTPGQTPQQGYGMPGQGVQPGMQAGMPGQTPQPGYGMPGQNVQPGYGMPQQPAGGNQPPKKKKTGLIVGLIILAVVLIGGVIFAFMKFGKKDGKGSSKDAEAAKQTVVDFCEGMKNRDMDAIVDAYYPDLQSSVADNFYTSNGVSSEDEFWNHYDTVFGGYSFAYTASDKINMTGAFYAIKSFSINTIINGVTESGSIEDVLFDGPIFNESITDNPDVMSMYKEIFKLINNSDAYNISPNMSVEFNK